ncbi:pumilio homolog 5 [Nicotiana sylvestris]|uniref:Pumilio homolog 5 n=1 Tax=Nicotiana sylvestris TaxID=4096 RepID=A0A1U7XK63_NICSY|nr:PREDICTED: pumilio homolog 5 [Nicotiana sylvestris]XP_009789997.1 PREDICTED: pumilio homolog 5 [Nicotiana sylvestris]XP_009789998.1 PREDICTED: pumilio homolog 5 [Nicotiana sylvestris]XP_009789999.1 PREDICTED: pumilio homolog 5 [Nicotiana sylvestris]
METESPMRILEDSRTEKWVPSKDMVSFVSPGNEVAADELGLLLKGHKIHGHNRNKVPNRSGSAPPSMEGSFSAFGNLVHDQSSGRKLSLASLDSAMQNWQSEEQMRADPSYSAYYSSNINLNPRLPPPIISRENMHLAHHFADLGDSCQLNSSDNSGDASLHVSRSSLSTHDEEPEDENLPRSALDDLAQSRASGQHMASFAGQHKSLVDLIQEDFPRTPSPVYNQSRPSCHVAVEEPTDCDIQSIKLDGLSVDISNKPGAGACADVSGDHNIAVPDQSLAISLEKESSVDSLGRSPSPQKGEISASDDAPLVNELLVSDGIASGISKNFPAPEISDNKDEQYFHGRNGVGQQQQQQYHSQRIAAYQVNSPQVQANILGTNALQSSLAKGYGHSWFSSVEVQAVPQGSGLTPPLYATAAAYMASGNPYYSNLSPPGVYAPHYNVGGYALASPSLPPFVAGYPSHSGLSVHINAGSGRSISGQSVTPRENIPQVGDLQHLTKFYGHHGLMVHPSFPDPFHMQYFHHPVDDSNTAPGRYMRFPSSGLVGLEVDAYASNMEPNLPYIAEQNFNRPPIGSLNLPSPGKMIIPGNSYFGSPSGLGFAQQFPASPLGSPVLPGSPMGRRSEIKSTPASGRNIGLCSGWPAQRGSGSFNDSKRHSFLEELKQSNARRIDLPDIAGRVIEFSVDQHGSRFIQQKLENCSIEEKASVFKEILPHASKLMTDVFGNYVIQKFFEHGSHEQRKMLACQLKGQMLPLSLQMYGCRVIQKALEVIDLDQKIELVHELNGHVLRCVRDQNGNHVIQKCIECIPTEKISIIISSFQSQVAILSTHPYGCRVIQRVLERCSENPQSQCIVHEILDSAYALAQDQYGNYVTQHVLERGKPHERSRIIEKLTGNVVQLSQHKYASNVVEKCLEYGDSAERELLIEEILADSEANDNLLSMMKDQFANYVVQKILEISNDKHRDILLSRIRVHLHALKKYTYGKHIVARFEQLSEQLSDEDIGTCEP